MSSGARVGFAGLSHLGIVSGIAAAARGFSVLAFDERAGLSDQLAAGQFPISEPGLEEAFQAHRQRLLYTAEAASMAACVLIFITLDVPTDDTNTSNLEPLRALIDKVAANAQPGAILVLMSQVPPGFSRDAASRLPPNVRLFYQVETLVFGNAVARAIHPERFIVGCPDPRVGIPNAYRGFLEAFECPVLPMRYESAELSKIAINCYLVSSVSTTNMLAEICEGIRADWSEVVPALRLDKRIGPHAYLTPGLGIAGGNLERDLVTIRRIASGCDADAGVVLAWQANSAHRKDWARRVLVDKGILSREPKTQVAVWGIAYKADTRSTKNSPSLVLIQSLKEYSVRAYDPAVALGPDDFPHVQNCGSALEAVAGADVLVVMTPWKEFSEVPLDAVRRNMRGRSIVDPFAALSGGVCRELGFDYYRIGIGQLDV
jgi:UDPglucose 6-dehydrogenase